MLTKHEIDLIDNYVLSNNLATFSEAHFYVVIHDIFPLWRVEELSYDRIYTGTGNNAYTDYCKSFITTVVE